MMLPVSLTPEYLIWKAMRKRCRNMHDTGYHKYGRRGIYVCQRWENFDNFLMDMGYRPSNIHSIERKNNDGPYSPSNCKWATRTEQARNKRNNRYVTYRKKKVLLRVLCEQKKIRFRLVWRRLKDGWTVAAAIEIPPLPTGKHLRRHATKFFDPRISLPVE